MITNQVQTKQTNTDTIVSPQIKPAHAQKKRREEDKKGGEEEEGTEEREKERREGDRTDSTEVAVSTG